jgi:hypothetical protein
MLKEDSYMSETNFVCVDCGASSTRYTSSTGTIDAIPNNMVILNSGADVELESYDSDLEDLLDVTIETDNKNTYFPCRVLIGMLAERYSKNNIRPSVMTNKTDQPTTYISIVVATALKKAKEGLTDDINLYITLPPVEAKYVKQKAIDNLVGNYTVKFNQSNKEVKFQITSVSIFPESYMSLMSFFFTMSGGLRDEAKSYRDGIVLSLDIGASTTDLAVAKDKKFLDKTGHTIKAGGNITRANFQEYVKGVYGFDVSIANSEKAIAEGRIQIGNKYEMCGEAVNTAKAILASTVVNELQTYFTSIGIPLQEVKAVCVSGGGSLAGQYVDEQGETIQTSRPVSEFIMDELHKICPSVDVIPYGDESRLANIKGLYIRANVDLIYAKKQAEKTQVTN